MKRLFATTALALACLFSGPSEAAIGTPVTVGSFSQTANGQTTVSVTLGTCVTSCAGASIPAGALVLCAITWEIGANIDHVTTVTDGTNTYTVEATQTGNAGDTNVAWAWVANAAAVANGGTITATFSTTEQYRSMACQTVTGIATTSPRDVLTSSPSGATPTSGAGTTTPVVDSGTLAQANEIIFAGGLVFIGQSDTYTENGGSGASTFTSQVTMGVAGGFHTASEIVSATTTQKFAPVLGTSREIAFQVISFKAAAAAASSPQSTLSLLGVGGK